MQHHTLSPLPLPNPNHRTRRFDVKRITRALAQFVELREGRSVDIAVSVYREIVHGIRDLDGVEEDEDVVFVQGEHLDDAFCHGARDVDETVAVADKTVGEVEDVGWGSDIAFLPGAVPNTPAPDEGIEMASLDRLLIERLVKEGKTLGGTHESNFCAMVVAEHECVIIHPSDAIRRLNQLICIRPHVAHRVAPGFGLEQLNS